MLICHGRFLCDLKYVTGFLCTNKMSRNKVIFFFYPSCFSYVSVMLPFFNFSYWCLSSLILHLPFSHAVPGQHDTRTVVPDCAEAGTCLLRRPPAGLHSHWPRPNRAGTELIPLSSHHHSITRHMHFFMSL